ncbi:hypothetical protein [Mycoplasma buteonis]|uniref:hypothetical protein n=1 Tax=Mycoplasma buteonis TaxID=171280 RepID=UPI0012EB6469|nr:hypothetical protein [Mycoplasma buteonis]
MNFLLGIESNVRWSAILGIVGIFGIGDFFHTFTKIEDMKYLGITILYIMLLVFFIEAILYTFNNFLFRENKYNLPQKSKWSIYRHKQIIKIVLFLFSLFYSLYGFMHILFDSSYIFNQNGFSEFFGTFFKLDFSEITNDPKVYLIYIKIAFQVYIVLFIGFFSAAFYSFFCADKLHNISIVFLFKLLLSFIKAIPIIIFFIIFNPILSTYAALTLSLAVSTFRSLAKQFNEHFNAISSKEINLLRDLGWSKWKIYIDFIFKKALKFVLGNASFEIEGTYRNAMNYSMFIPSGIGIYELISRYSKYNQYGKIVPLLLPAIILFISLELSYLFIKTKKFQKDNLRWTN